jgi:hypothetical protein
MTMAFAAGQFLTASLLNSTFPPSGSDTQNTLGSTTATAFTATLSGGTACGFAFTAPLSGVVMVYNSSVVDNSDAAQRSYCTFRIRTGGTIGSGTDFWAAADASAIYNLGTADNSYGRAIRVPGLTAGATYNVQQLFRSAVGTATATFLNKHLAVLPVI